MSIALALALGAAAGMAWGLWAPGVRGLVTRVGVGYYDGQTDNFFLAVAGFVGLSAVGGILNGAGVFRGGRRTVRGVWSALGSACLAVAVAAWLGEAIVDARFHGPAAVGGEFTAPPTIHLNGAVVMAHPTGWGSGTLAWLASWVVLLAWPTATAAWCTAVALVRGVDEPDSAPDSLDDEAAGAAPAGAVSAEPGAAPSV